MNQIAPASSFLSGERLDLAPTEYETRFVESGGFQCKFITGRADENATCCGAPTDGKSWCSYHRGIVFTQALSGRIR